VAAVEAEEEVVLGAHEVHGVHLGKAGLVSLRDEAVAHPGHEEVPDGRDAEGLHAVGAPEVPGEVGLDIEEFTAGIPICAGAPVEGVGGEPAAEPGAPGQPGGETPGETDPRVQVEAAEGGEAAAKPKATVKRTRKIVKDESAPEGGGESKKE